MIAIDAFVRAPHRHARKGVLQPLDVHRNEPDRGMFMPVYASMRRAALPTETLARRLRSQPCRRGEWRLDRLSS